jgi:hypothetical protein
MPTMKPAQLHIIEKLIAKITVLENEIAIFNTTTQWRRRIRLSAACKGLIKLISKSPIQSLGLSFYINS